ncbi:MAG: hypothetical protein QMB51_02855 [Patescibacteria group bacterium]
MCKKNSLNAFGGILNFLTGKKNSINKEEAQRIFYPKKENFKEALQELNSGIKDKAPNILTENATEDAIYVAEQIALTVDVK